MLSGLASGMTKSHKERIVLNMGVMNNIKVQIMTFGDVMANYQGVKHIDFLSIDVEGGEMNILKTIDFKNYTFGLIVIENNESTGVLANYMKKNGYKEFMSVGDDILFIPQHINLYT